MVWMKMVRESWFGWNGLETMSLMRLGDPWIGKGQG